MNSRPSITVSFENRSTSCPDESITRFLIFLNTPIAHQAATRSGLYPEIVWHYEGPFLQAFCADSASQLVTALLNASPKATASFYVPYELVEEDWPDYTVKYILDYPVNITNDPACS